MMNQHQLQQAIYQIPSAKKILNCIQCGTCSGSCPFSDRMDHTPRELFALIRDGEISEVFRSNTPWFCVSCYHCMVRCPQELAVTDLMYFVKQMAIKNNLAAYNNKIPDLYYAFRKEVEHHGRVNSTLLMARYGRKHPVDMFSKLSLGFKLWFKKRLEIVPRKVKCPKRIADLIKHHGCRKK